MNTTPTTGAEMPEALIVHPEHGPLYDFASVHAYAVAHAASLSEAAPAVAPSDTALTKSKLLASQGRRFEALRHYRNATGCSLKDARDAIYPAEAAPQQGETAGAVYAELPEYSVYAQDTYTEEEMRGFDEDDMRAFADATCALRAAAPHATAAATTEAGAVTTEAAPVVAASGAPVAAAPMSAEPSDAELDALDKGALHAMAPRGRDSVRAFARAVLARWGAAPQPPAVLVPRYRLLQADIDRIEATDEFLSDDTTTWAPDPNGIFVGMAYAARVLRPARRLITGAPDGKQT